MQRIILGVIHVDCEATGNKFCIRQILDKKWKHNEAVHQLFIDFLESLCLG